MYPPDPVFPNLMLICLPKKRWEGDTRVPTPRVVSGRNITRSMGMVKWLPRGKFVRLDPLGDKGGKRETNIDSLHLKRKRRQKGKKRGKRGGNACAGRDGLWGSGKRMKSGPLVRER